ncbi:MAG: golvesin C-terminal-like domain-containing protein [Armatimonadota bacterium]
MFRSTLLQSLMIAVLIGTSASADVSVITHGAKGDGKTDDTAAFQKALDAAVPNGDVVRVPAGSYLIAGSLSIPRGVTLKGVWEAPHFPEADKGTMILATGNANNEEAAPLFSLTQNSCLQGMTIFYPEQDPRTMKSYPWTIQGSRTHCSVIDITLVNPYKGIDFGTYPNEMHYIRNVYGCPLKIGIFVDKCTDIGRIENVHFNPNAYTRLSHPNAATGDKGAALVEYLHNNLVGFIFGRTDWEYVNNCFVIFPLIGFHFKDAGGGGGNVLLSQSGADICSAAAQIDACQSHAGISFVNSQMFGRVNIGETNTGPVRFTGCGFFGATSEKVKRDPSHVDVKGRGHVSLDNCHFITLDGNNNTTIDIQASGGGLSINNCQFIDTNKTHVLLQPGLRTGIIACNTFRGKAVIEDKSGANVQIGLNVDDSPKPDEPNAIIVDDLSAGGAFTTEGTWMPGQSGNDYNRSVKWAAKGNGENKAYWKPNILKSGTYAVYVWYGNDLANDHATNAPYVVKYKDGTKEFRINLKQKTGQWVLLGEFSFTKGKSGYVMTSNDANGNVVADAVKFVPVESKK